MLYGLLQHVCLHSLSRSLADFHVYIYIITILSAISSPVNVLDTPSNPSPACMNLRNTELHRRIIIVVMSKYTVTPNIILDDECCDLRFLLLLIGAPIVKF